LSSVSIRSLFMAAVPLVPNKPVNGHSHPDAASARNASVSTMSYFASLFGMRPYFMQKSASDVRNGRAGCRTYYWGKDLNVRYSPYNPLDSDIIVFSDVDMYVDMPSYLAQHPRPVLISTFQPSHVAQSTGEYTFTFDSNNNVHYIVSGGAEYVHSVWNYSCDIISAVSVGWFFNRTTIYNVDRKQCDPHHQILLLTPVRTFSYFRLFSSIINLEVNILDKLRVVEKDLLRLTVHTVEGAYRCTGRVNSFACAKITAAQDDSLACLSRISGVKLSPAGIKTALGDVSEESAVILTEYHGLKTSIVPDNVYPMSKSVHNYQFLGPGYDANAKESMVPFMNPIIDECFSPVKSLSNDNACIDGRVVNVASFQQPLPIDIQMMQEFIELLIPVSEIGDPVDISEVYERQSRPTQRHILDSASFYVDPDTKSKIQSFQKSETYDSVKDPRNISTIPKINKYKYSRFAYAFSNSVMKKQSWYAFGKSPLEIAERCAVVCKRARKHVVLSDFSRMDGRVSPLLRTLERMACLRFFRRKYHEELLEIQATQSDQRAITTFGRRYTTGSSRLSGSAETADFNSLDNGFVAYKTKRSTINPETGKHFTPLEAWAALGIYGGDDGLTDDIDLDIYAKTSSSVGQLLDCAPVPKGSLGVSFLARDFGPGVWQGDPSSVCDIRRQLSKLHVTISLSGNITPEQKLFEKILGYSFTDINTPIIGEICNVAIANFPQLLPERLGIGELCGVTSYHARNSKDESVQFPNTDEAHWMSDYVLKRFPLFDFVKFRSWLSEVSRTKSLALLLSPPLCEPPRKAITVSKAAVVDSDVIRPAKSSDPGAGKTSEDLKRKPIKYTADELKKFASTPCRQFLTGACKFGDKCRFKH